MTDIIEEYKRRHSRKLRLVHGQMDHLCSKNWLCMCKNNGAQMVMACNAASLKRFSYEHQKVPKCRAIAVGDSYSDPIRVAAMLAHDKPWDEVIIVGDREGPLYDQRAGILHVKTPSELPPIESFDPTKRSLVIFDECGRLQGRDQQIMEAFFIRSRLRGVSTLSVECCFSEISKLVLQNTDVLYLTSAPHQWDKFQQLRSIRSPLADCFAGARPNSWFKIDMRNNETKVIDASKYYP